MLRPLPFTHRVALRSARTWTAQAYRSASSSSTGSSAPVRPAANTSYSSSSYTRKAAPAVAPKPAYRSQYGSSATSSYSRPASSTPTSNVSSSSSSLKPPTKDEPHPFAPQMRTPNFDGDDLSYNLDGTTNTNTDTDTTQAESLPDASPEAYPLQSQNQAPVDWSKSFHGLSTIPFDRQARDILLEPVPAEDVEVKPDGIVYLPEIKYRRILNRAFGPGGWGLAPRGDTTITPKLVTREYGLVVHGRLVSIARGEQQYFDVEGVPTATEGCKSNALMRCCKDLGIASELWDPVFIRAFARTHTSDIWVEHAVTKKRRKITVKKGTTPSYPYKLSIGGGGGGSQ